MSCNLRQCMFLFQPFVTTSVLAKHCRGTLERGPFSTVAHFPSVAPFLVSSIAAYFGPHSKYNSKKRQWATNENEPRSKVTLSVLSVESLNSPAKYSDYSIVRAPNS